MVAGIPMENPEYSVMSILIILSQLKDMWAVATSSLPTMTTRSTFRMNHLETIEIKSTVGEHFLFQHRYQPKERKHTPPPVELP